jgi:hypothetical protein
MTTPQDPGRQGYAPPPGYPPQPGYGPGGYPPYGYRPPTNTVAILALVFAFVFAPAGLVLGIVARRQIARTREQGSGLALAGIIVGAVLTVIWVLVIVVWIIALAALSGSNGTF